MRFRKCFPIYTIFRLNLQEDVEYITPVNVTTNHKIQTNRIFNSPFRENIHTSRTKVNFKYEYLIRLNIWKIPYFRFFSRIALFRYNWDFVAKLRFFTKIEIFLWRLRFFTKFKIFTILDIFELNWDFLQQLSFLRKLRFFTTIEIFYENWLFFYENWDFFTKIKIFTIIVIFDYMKFFTKIEIF